MTSTKPPNEERKMVAIGDSLSVKQGFNDAPWFIVLYLFAFILFVELDWKLGIGWLLWRMANSARETWQKRQEIKNPRPTEVRRGLE